MEWENMSYTLYPYYWGRKNKWVVTKSLKDTDPIHQQFLQAGCARVLLPVRRGFEESMLHYLQTQGEIWNGGVLPAVLGDDNYISIVDVLKAQQGQYIPGTAFLQDEWETVLPTNLVYLDGDINLPDNS